MNAAIFWLLQDKSINRSLTDRCRLSQWLVLLCSWGVLEKGH